MDSKDLPVAGLGQDEQQRIRDILAQLSDEGWGEAEITIGGETGSGMHAMEEEDFEDACEESQSTMPSDAVQTSKDHLVESTHVSNEPLSVSAFADSEPRQLEEDKGHHPDITPSRSVVATPSAEPPLSSAPPAPDADTDSGAAFGRQIVPKHVPPPPDCPPAPLVSTATVEPAADGGGAAAGSEGTLLERLLKGAVPPSASARPEIPDVQVGEPPDPTSAAAPNASRARVRSCPPAPPRPPRRLSEAAHGSGGRWWWASECQGRAVRRGRAEDEQGEGPARRAMRARARPCHSAPREGQIWTQRAHGSTVYYEVAGPGGGGGGSPPRSPPPPPRLPRPATTPTSAHPSTPTHIHPPPRTRGARIVAPAPG